MSKAKEAVSGAIKSQREKKLSELRELEPDKRSLRAPHWPADVPMDVRRNIQFAARLSMYGEGWETIADVLGFKSQQDAVDAVVTQYPDEWEHEQNVAWRALLLTKLPKQSIQVLKSILDNVTDEKKRKKEGVEYKDAATLAIRAAESIRKMMSDVEDVSSGDKIKDDVEDETVQDTREWLNSLTEEIENG